MAPLDSEHESDHRSWLPSTILLVDRSPSLVGHWKEQFADCSAVEVVAGDYFQRSADAIVSPANCFGIMDGGLDLAIRNELGYSVQKRLQDLIVEKHHGELPIGVAEIVRTNQDRWRYMVAAPTMRIPEPIPHTINAYLAFRAVLVAIENFNKQAKNKEIDSLVSSGFGTGVGEMSSIKCARQMRAAWDVVRAPSRIASFQEIHDFHGALRMM